MSVAKRWASVKTMGAKCTFCGHLNHTEAQCLTKQKRLEEARGVPAQMSAIPDEDLEYQRQLATMSLASTDNHGYVGYAAHMNTCAEVGDGEGEISVVEGAELRRSARIDTREKGGKVVHFDPDGQPKRWESHEGLGAEKELEKEV